MRTDVLSYKRRGLGTLDTTIDTDALRVILLVLRTPAQNEPEIPFPGYAARVGGAGDRAAEVAQVVRVEVDDAEAGAVFCVDEGHFEGCAMWGGVEAVGVGEDVGE